MFAICFQVLVMLHVHGIGGVIHWCIVSLLSKVLWGQSSGGSSARTSRCWKSSRASVVMRPQSQAQTGLGIREAEVSPEEAGGHEGAEPGQHRRSAWHLPPLQEDLGAGGL